MTFLTPRLILLAVALISAGSLGAAYIGEIYFGLKPCVLCLYQRYAYMSTLALGIIGVCLPQMRQHLVTLYITALGFFVNFGIATYQVLVEKKILNPPGVCKGVEIETQGQTFAQFKASLAQAGDHVPCDAVAWDLFGISMAGYNALFTLLCTLAILAITTLLYAPSSQRKLSHDR